MSGSAALSAAKNRRTANSTPVPSQKVNETAPQQQLDGPKNPLQILYIHEMRLNKLETDNAESDKLDSNKLAHETVINSLTDKLTLLEKQYSQLKDELMKIMSFAMETNRAFLLYKNDKEQPPEPEAI